ncbi:MAG: thiamine phosphate synthase [Oscillospiraceae bacterium]|nr:thiamine phosphate synthase [Oscillospiraceae bacterium]
MKFRKENLILYGITDSKLSENRDFFEMAEKALEGGVTIMQLREKNLEKNAFIEKACKLKEICHKYNVPLIIDDDLDVAVESKADGIHVGADDISVEEIRKVTSKDFIIGATAKTVEQAILAEKSGADYLGVGAVFPSPTKKNAIRIDEKKLKEICQSVKIPAVAIGGINFENANKLSNCSISGIAVVSAIFAENDILNAAKRLRKKAESLL